MQMRLPSRRWGGLSSLTREGQQERLSAVCGAWMWLVCGGRATYRLVAKGWTLARHPDVKPICSSETWPDFERQTFGLHRKRSSANFIEC